MTTVDVDTPDEPPTVTPGVARALLTILRKADQRRQDLEEQAA